MWALTKKARLYFGYGVDGQCTNCTTNDKTLAIAYDGDNVDNIMYCITPNQTNNALQLNVHSYNRYSFTNGIWEAKDWQVQSIQQFTNAGYKQITAYNCYMNCGCGSGLTTIVKSVITRINATFVSDNGNDCTVQISNDSDCQYWGVTVTKSLYQEINGVWTSLATATVPIGVRGYTITVQQNITIPSSQSQTPLHFKASMTPNGGDESWTDMWVECKFTGEPPLTPTPPSKEFIDYGKAYCKIVNYKCIGRFNDVEELEELADQKLVNILATNDTFFNSLL